MVFCLCLYVCACRDSEIVCRSNYPTIKALKGRAVLVLCHLVSEFHHSHHSLFSHRWDVFWLSYAHSLLSRASAVFEDVHPASLLVKTNAT